MPRFCWGLLLLVVASLNRAQALSVDEFIAEVKEAHQGLRGALLKAEADAGQAAGVKVAYAFTLFSELKHTDDRTAGGSSPILPGVTSKNDRLAFGVSKQERFGLQSKLSYSLQQSRLDGIPSGYGIDGSFSTASLGVELSQPLWKNAFGRDFTVQDEGMRLGSQAQVRGDHFQAQQILVASEKAYWKLASKRELAKIQQASYLRAQAIVGWQARRVSKNLADQADLLQAQAALKVRELEREASASELRLALKQCNELRSKEASQELLSDFPSKAAVLQLALPQRGKQRGDLEAARLFLLASRKNVELSYSKFTPSLDLIFNGALTSKEGEFTQAAGATLSPQHPNYTIALRFSMPLLEKNLYTGLDQAQQQGLRAQELSVNQQAADQEHEWEELQQRLSDGKRRFTLSSELEAAQLGKVKAEQSRLQAGRSTTYQMEMFEQEFLGAQVGRVLAAAQILEVIASMRIFEDEAL